MKLIFYSIFQFFVMISSNPTFYGKNFGKIDGGDFNTNSCQGKKVMVVTLPIENTILNRRILESLDSIEVAYHDSLTIIAVPGIEDGYFESNRAALMQWYRSKLNSSIVISKGMYTSRSSGAFQDPLFKWLTEVNQNQKFNVDTHGPFTRFFVNGAGELYGFIKPSVGMGSNTINLLLTTVFE